MGRLGLSLLMVAAVAASTIDVASAADGCGRGWYNNGYRCAPIGRDYERSYGPPGYYAPGEGRPPGRPDCYNYHGRRICCPHRWTVQDGVCKPYTGR